VASHVRISAQRSTRINVLTGADHEAVKVQAGLLPAPQLCCPYETGAATAEAVLSCGCWKVLSLKVWMCVPALLCGAAR